MGIYFGRGKLGEARRGRKGQERDGAMEVQDGGKGKMDAGTQWGQEREGNEGERKDAGTQKE